MPTSDHVPAAFDLFVSYAHADDQDKDSLKVTSLVDAIKADYQRVAGVPLRVFFDVEEIRAMDDWESRILLGLRQSKMMVALLSPAYFKSDYCRKEWETYVETELAHALPGDGITPIYVVRHPGFEAGSAEERLKHWVRDLKRRQYVDWIDFWPHGAAALERADVRRRLDALPGQIAERLRRAEARERSPNSVPEPSSKFVGRRDEMHQLLTALLDSHIGAITAVNGIPGIGKSMLAFAYAWGYGFKYPGGRFLIPAANLSDLATGVIALAERKGVPLTDQERQQPDIALAKVKKAFEEGPPALLVIDNLDDPRLLEAQARDRVLPRGGHIHVLVTTRVSPDDLPRIHCLPLDALEPQDAVALLNGFRPIADSPQDDEWKAALDIVNRLGCHALAVEVVGVFLREKQGKVSYRQFAEILERDGISMMEEKVGPRVHGKLEWHAESCLARLLEPTLQFLSPAESRAVEYAALLPPDNVPLPWVRALLLAEYPTLGGEELDDPIDDLFRRLERLRLVVPLGRDRAANSKGDAGPAETHLARMHRLVQDVVRRRVGADREASMDTTVNQLVSGRARWMNAHWGQTGLAWELPALRDMIARMIDRGDRDSAFLVVQIAKPLRHIGRLLDVRTLWLKAEKVLRQLHEDAPDNTDYAHNLSASYEGLGDLAREQGDVAGARRHYEDGLAIRRRLAAANPDNPNHARGLPLGYQRLGDMAWAQGDVAGARRYFEDGLAIARRLAAAVPDNADYAQGLSIIYDRQGDLAGAQGDMAGARRYFEDGLAIARRLAAAVPDNADYAQGLAIFYIRLGDLALAQGDVAVARRFFEDGLAIRRRLAAMAPDNADYARGLAIFYIRLGDLALAQGDVAVARRFFEDGLAIRRRLAAAVPDNADYARDLFLSDDRLGDLTAAQGDVAGARRHYEDGLAITRRLLATAPDNADYARDVWVSYWKIAHLLDQTESTEALVWWRRAWEILSGMEGLGMDISPDDGRVLTYLESRFGFGR